MNNIPVIKSDNCHKSQGGHFVTEASDHRDQFPIGRWPSAVSFDGKILNRFSMEKDADGDLICLWYRDVLKTTELVVYND